jgi:hypothetical protein
MLDVPKTTCWCGVEVGGAGKRDDVLCGRLHAWPSSVEVPHTALPAAVTVLTVGREPVTEVLHGAPRPALRVPAAYSVCYTCWFGCICSDVVSQQR